MGMCVKYLLYYVSSLIISYLVVPFNITFNPGTQLPLILVNCNQVDMIFVLNAIFHKFEIVTGVEEIHIPTWVMDILVCNLTQFPQFQINSTAPLLIGTMICTMTLPMPFIMTLLMTFSFKFTMKEIWKKLIQIPQRNLWMVFNQSNVM